MSLEYHFLGPISLSAEFVTECSTLWVRPGDAEGFALMEVPLGARAGLKACTSCCHATVRQSPGYQTQLIHHLVIFQSPFQVWLPELKAVFQSLLQLCCKIMLLLLISPTHIHLKISMLFPHHFVPVSDYDSAVLSLFVVVQQDLMMWT